MADSLQSKPDEKDTCESQDLSDKAAHDADWTSSSGSSSEDEDDEDEGNAADGAKPAMKTAINQDLKSRLASFIPQIQHANKQLEDPDEARKHQVDDDASDGDHYVEMNLGLGVLTEKKHQDGIQTCQEDSDSDSDSDLLVTESSNRKNTTKIEEI